ncbi:MAG TPA: serine/threonine-protein kinase, partial [Gemmataceae bacterium]
MPSERDPRAPLCSESWLRRERRIGAYESAWRRGARPALEDYLSGNSPDRAELLVELVRVELELRRRAGEAVTPEEYLRRFPELAGRAELFQLPARVPAPGGATVAAAVPGGLTRLGRYELREVAGEGVFGVVYRAWDTELGRDVALKIPRPGALPDGAARERFLREARSLAPLRHRHIVTLYDVGHAEGLDFLVCEYVPGPTLCERMREGPLPPRRAAELLARVADAVGYAHRRGVVHRDLKPSNILLDPDGFPRVTDFGLSAWVGDLRAAGEVAGTPAYMAPELARGDPAATAPAADVYSLGAILYEMLTGAVPDRDSARPEPPRGDGVAPELAAVCRRCLAREPAERYRAAEELAADLRRCAGETPAPRTPLRRPGGWRAGRPAAVGAVSVLALVLVLANLVVAARTGDAPPPDDGVATPAEDPSAVRLVALTNHLYQFWRPIQKEFRRYPRTRPTDRELREAGLLGDRARALLERLGEVSDPAQVEKLVARLAWVLYWAADTQFAAGRYQDALRNLDAAHTTLQPLLDADPDWSRGWAMAASNRDLSAQAAAEAGNLPRALLALDQCEAGWRRVLDAKSDEPHKALQNLFRCHCRRLEYLRALGRDADVRAALPEAARLGTELVGRHAPALSRKDLVAVWRNLAGLWEELGDRPRAIRAYTELVRVCEETLAQAPGDARAQFELGSAYHMLGRQQRDAGQWAASEKSFARALELRRKLRESNPDHLGYLNDLAWTCHDLG